MFIAVQTGPALAVVIALFGRCESRLVGVGQANVPNLTHPPPPTESSARIVCLLIKMSPRP